MRSAGRIAIGAMLLMTRLASAAAAPDMTVLLFEEFEPDVGTYPVRRLFDI